MRSTLSLSSGKGKGSSSPRDQLAWKFGSRATLMQSTLSTILRVKERGHKVPAMGVLSASGAHFQRGCKCTQRHRASNRMAKANRASHGPRVRANNARVQRKIQKEPDVPKERTRCETSKTGLSGLVNSKSEASSDTQESAQTCLTDTSSSDGWNGDVWNDGWSVDQWYDDWSSVEWHEGWEQTYDTSASSFSLGGS